MSIVSIITVGDLKQAEEIARRLVGERLAACVNILPSMRSVYRWKDRVEESTEFILLVKTEQRVFEKMKRRVLELHSYELPEIIALDISEGLEGYLDWISSNVE
ncbi:MAG: divalent-cation tolerance protein CutA [Candidatus Methanosuratincola sp.]|jgi:periplasmic divalent cation tolerance protein|nr:divalent-cation tolerance protein CutA [Candidatus Methanosuratincola sp.]